MRQTTEDINTALLQCLVMTLMFLIIQASTCDEPPPVLTVDYEEHTLVSPGYPRHYNSNLDCVWIFHATSNKTAGFGIQVATTDLELELDLEATTLDLCDTDYLELFEGTPSHLGRRIGIWCGRDKKAVKSARDSLTMKFHSNAHHSGKGFAIGYALVKIAPSDCLPGDVTHIYAARAPLYVDLTVRTKDSRCMWRIEAIDNLGATDPSSVLVVEAVSIPRTWCKDGHVILLDGPVLTSPQVTHWCNGREAFSVVHLSTNYATVSFAFNGVQQFQSDTIQLKIYSKSKTFQQTCSETALPEIQVNTHPVFFHLPIDDVKGNTCPVRVSQGVKDNLLRIEVLRVNGHFPTCTDNTITVERAHGDKKPVEQSCNRHQYPMYLPMAADAVVRSSVQVLLKAVSTEASCAGVSSARVATTSLLMEDTLPRGFTHTVPAQSCISKYLITAVKEHLVIALWLQWSQREAKKQNVTSSDDCMGDFVNIYDGKNESSPLLFSTCRTSNGSDPFVDIKVIGTGSKMLVLFESEDVADSNFVRIVYYALPGNIHCSKTQVITVTSDVQELTSPNYPHFYTLDYDCTYKLATKNTKEVIVIEAEHTEFNRGCESILHIRHVDGSVLQNDYSTHLCGYHKNKTHFSNDRPFVLTFQSAEFGLSGRWKLKIYSLATGRAGRCPFRDNEFVNLALIVISYLLIV